MLIDNIVIVYNEYFSTLKLQNEYNIIFSKNVNEYTKINNNFVKKQNNNKNMYIHTVEKSKTNDNKLKFVKKTFRKLSKIIHPDKNHANSNLFIQSKEAYDNECVSELIYLSYISDLRDINIPDYMENIINNELQIIKLKINELKSTISWKWSTCNNTEKEQIINLIKDM